MDERFYRLALRMSPGIGPGKFSQLVDHFKCAKKVWEANEIDLRGCGIGKASAAQFVNFRTKFVLESYLKSLEKSKVDFCTQIDDFYPENLKQIDKAPAVLFYRGKIDKLNTAPPNTRLAVVGSRKVTPYGRQVTEFIVKDLADAGCLIISGLALGVDAIAHKTTIENAGITAAVLGNGAEQCYPRENMLIYNSILESGGVIVSEYPPNTTPNRGTFPSRNRIIAGLSDAVIVTEGTQDSGSLITAADARAQGKKVFAIPGPITSTYSKGPNSLISEGAVPIMSAGDILKNLSISNNNQKILKQIKGGSKEEQLIIDMLMTRNMHVNEIVKTVKLPVSKINIILSLMEMKGIVKSSGTGMFALNAV